MKRVIAGIVVAALLSSSASAQQKRVLLSNLAINPRTQTATVNAFMNAGFPIGQVAFTAKINCAAGTTSLTSTAPAKDNAAALKALADTKALQMGATAMTLTIKDQTTREMADQSFDGSLRLFCKDKVLHTDIGKLIKINSLRLSNNGLTLTEVLLSPGNVLFAIPIEESAVMYYTMNVNRGMITGVGVSGTLSNSNAAVFIYNRPANKLMPLRYDGSSVGPVEEQAALEAMVTSSDVTSLVEVYYANDYTNPTSGWWKTTYDLNTDLIWTEPTTMPKNATFGN